jgi:hypothetical protein
VGLIGREPLDGDAPAAAATPSCTLSPEVTEGRTGESTGPELVAASGRGVTEFMRPRSGPAARGAWGDAES